MSNTDRDNFPSGYVISEKLGEGGTSVVYLARRIGNESHLVALKIFSSQEAEKLAEREIETAGQIDFPGIVSINDWGRSENKPHYIEMEYCPGHTLDAIAGKITEPKLLSTLSAISASLHVLHTGGYTHNDIKPENIFAPIGFEGNDFAIDQLYYLKISDFSLAGKINRLSDKKPSSTDAPTGTVGYMSPEMINGRGIKPTSDLFSLGVLAFRLACGVLPFISEKNDPQEINALITEGFRPRFSGPGAHYSDKTKELILSLLEANPDDRPHSAFELQEILARAGSPFPFRKSIRPRHLLSKKSEFNAAELERIFGKGSFSSGQLKYIRQVSGYGYIGLRLILEQNFDRGSFARLNGRWGWKDRTVNVIDWSEEISKLSLRQIRGTSKGLKSLALTLALAEDDCHRDEIIDELKTNSGQYVREWLQVKKDFRPLILHTLKCRMSAETGRILARRFLEVARQSQISAGLKGRMLVTAGENEKAIEYLIVAADAAKDDLMEKEPLLFDLTHETTFGYLEMAIDAAEKIGDLRQQAEVTLKKALKLKDLGRLSESEACYIGLIELVRDRNLDHILALAYKQIGDVYKANSDHKSGIRVLNQALILYQRLEDQLGLSHTLNNLGNMYWVVGRLQDARDHYTQALEIQTRLDSQKDIASSLNNIGSILIIQGNFSESVSYFSRSLTIKEKLGDQSEIARTWNNIGAARFLTGNTSQAIDAFSHSLKINRELDDWVEQLLNIENLAETMCQAGRLDQALDYLKQGSKLAEKIGDEIHKGAILGLTGQLLRRMGYYHDAEIKLIDAYEIGREKDNQPLQLSSAMNLARLKLVFQETAKCEQYINQAREIAETAGDKSAQFHLALIKLRQTGNEEYKNLASGLLDSNNMPRDKALLQLTVLEIENKRGIPKSGQKQLTLAGEFFEKQDEDIDQSRYLLVAGNYYFQAGDFEKSLEYISESLAVSEKRNLLPELWQAACLESEVLLEKRDLEGAYRAARRTLEILKKIAAGITDNRMQQKLYNNPKIISLLGRIKSLQLVLNKKAGAVS